MTSNWLTPSVSSLEFTVFFMSDDRQGDILNFVPLLFPQRSEYEQTVCLCQVHLTFLALISLFRPRYTLLVGTCFN